MYMYMYIHVPMREMGGGRGGRGGEGERGEGGEEGEGERGERRERGRGGRGGGREFSTDFEEFSKEVKKACCHLMTSARLPVSNSTSLPDRLQTVGVETHTIAQLSFLVSYCFICSTIINMYNIILLHTHRKHFPFSSVQMYMSIYTVVSCTMYMYI